MAGRAPRRGTPAPVKVELAPVVLVKGSEGLLADRATAKLRALALQADPNVERTELGAATYQAGQLEVITSPSLFGEARLVTVPDLEALNEALQEDLLAYLVAPAPDVWLILRHPGGNARGKKVTDAVAKAGFPVIAAEPLKKDADKLDLLRADAKERGRALDNDAAQMLVEALGEDVRSMAAALAQLMDDVEGRITVEHVRTYHGGRVEAKGFDVADAAIAGQSARALTLLRHSLATGTDPVPLVAALAMKVRQLAKASICGSAQAAGMSPWLFDKVRRDLRGWDDTSLAAAVEAVALADEEVKGLSKDPHRAIEKAVITVCRLRGSR
ncbi:DNA polymerase III subunit delta [Schaalia sp. 19OD2882]|uniref:DNA polymerase III subunit delta n=1 Tax=Schaalia sp. 19OD2882 TaxID=2794089 RepID=UPI001C1ED5E9|nr:DNA polymerase III subunit delta [Schaalia sp. 19OD2882]QWW19046.1 DNA polymerase III subunit delta [Schaalia sp. 19OD2882]